MHLLIVPKCMDVCDQSEFVVKPIKIIEIFSSDILFVLIEFASTVHKCRYIARGLSVDFVL